MGLLRMEDIQELLEYRGSPCVSVIFPTVSGSAEVAQNVVRFKNCIHRAKDILLEKGYGNIDVDMFFERAKQFYDDPIYWNNQSKSFALFMSPKFFKTFKLPRTLEQAVAVQDTFYCKPLLPLFFAGGSFYVLALSQNKVRLLQGSMDGLQQIEAKDVPANIDETLRQFVGERHVEWHTQLPRQSDARRQAYFHGQGVGSLHSEDKILQYMYSVDKGIHPILKEEHVPLIFAGVDFLFPMYQQANTYKYLLPESIHGSMDRIQDDEIHKAALKLMEPVYAKTRKNALEKFYQFAGTGHTTTTAEKIVLWAVDGAIEALLIAKDAKLLGTFDRKNRKVELHKTQQSDSQDLLDIAESEVFMSGGRIVEMPRDEMPDKLPLAAILRATPDVMPNAD